MDIYFSNYCTNTRIALTIRAKHAYQIIHMKQNFRICSQILTRHSNRINACYRCSLRDASLLSGEYKSSRLSSGESPACNRTVPLARKTVPKYHATTAKSKIRDTIKQALHTRAEASWRLRFCRMILTLSSMSSPPKGSSIGSISQSMKTTGRISSELGLRFTSGTTGIPWFCCLCCWNLGCTFGMLSLQEYC